MEMFVREDRAQWDWLYEYHSMVIEQEVGFIVRKSNSNTQVRLAGMFYVQHASVWVNSSSLH